MKSKQEKRTYFGWTHFVPKFAQSFDYEILNFNQKGTNFKFFCIVLVHTMLLYAKYVNSSCSAYSGATACLFTMTSGLAADSQTQKDII